jgi:Spy/CpxP family protein refolding chaperone
MKRIFRQLSSRIWFAAGFMLLAMISFDMVARAQTSPENNAMPEARGENSRRTLLQALNLTPEQQNEIRRISAQSADERRQLQQRWQATRRALDEAIYSGEADEALIEMLAREAAEAQAAIIRMRALTEYRIRRVLTLEQLQTLRELRARFPRRRDGLRGMGRPRRREHRPRPMPQVEQ